MNRKYLMMDLYHRWLEGETIDVDKNKDPYWDPLDDIFLGRCATASSICFPVYLYSETCHERPLHGTTENGLMRKVVFHCRYKCIEM